MTQQFSQPRVSRRREFLDVNVSQDSRFVLHLIYRMVSQMRFSTLSPPTCQPNFQSIHDSVIQLLHNS
jgi:hypothetical protein